MSDLVKFCLWIYPVLFAFYIPANVKDNEKLTTVDNIVASAGAAAFVDFIIYCIIMAITIALRHA